MSNKLSTEEVKRRTLDLYAQLPQHKMIRKMETVTWDDEINRWVWGCHPEMYPDIKKIRDEIIEINYTFFGYIASKTFINNTSIEYLDKFQSALMHFCECWWWYKWKGDKTHKGYRQDIAFSVFFKPRVGEMIERELNEVKYSIRRSLCIEVGQQLVPPKHWAKVTYEDLSDPHVHLPADKMNSLKSIFGSLYIADISKHESYLSTSTNDWRGEFDDRLDVEYDSWEDLLIYYMVEEQSDLADADLERIAEIHNVGELESMNRPRYHTDTEIDYAVVGFYTLKNALPRAKQILYERLHTSLDIKKTFE